MCLITIVPPGVHLTRAQIIDAMSKNGDGVGIMYSDAGQLYTGRTMSRSPAKIDRWLRSSPIDVERVIHFRKTTAGITHRRNLHPFELHGRFGLMHNGTLPDALAETSKKDPRSDTAIFAQDLLSLIEPDMLQNAGVWKLIDVAVESNRVILLDGETGELRWTADDLWTETKEGLILSNTYSIDKGETWGVKKKTFYEFHGYSPSYWGGSRSYVSASPSPAPAPASASASASAPAVLGNPPAKLHPVASSLPASSDEDVMSTIYVMRNYDKVLPYSGRASQHPMYGAASRLADSLMTTPMATSGSTMLIALLFAGLTHAEIPLVKTNEARIHLDALIDFATTTPRPTGFVSSPGDIYLRYKERLHADIVPGGV